MDYTLITGACGGLGRAFVFLLAEKNTPLYLLGRREEKLSALAEELRARYPSLPVLYAKCDLREDSDRNALFARWDRENTRFCRLVYVAGADVQKPLEKYSEEKIILQCRANFEGLVSLTHAVFARKGSLIPEFLAIGSVSGIYPMPYFSLYSATKKAVEQFYSAMHEEWKGRARVTCALPGAIPTREDVKENIRTQGLWGKLAACPPDFVAKKCLSAVKRNKRRVIVGFWNKAMRFFTFFLPEQLKMRFIAKRWSKTEKDAF